MYSAFRFKDGGRVPLRYIRYLCPVCDRPHNDSFGAANCCEPDIDIVNFCPVCNTVHATPEQAVACHSDHGANGMPATICPTCHTTHEWVDSAIDCCLWKSLDIGQRHRLGMRLAASAIRPCWTTDICDEFGIVLTAVELAVED